jgi:uncharacterized repeat protein (TIGR03803 family)
MASILPVAGAVAATLTTLYSFCSQPNCADGELPLAPLLDVGGTLYGTTGEGGAYHEGTVFFITPQGAEMVLHSFYGTTADGAEPLYGGLVAVGGKLYGATYGGGGHGSTQPGTVFSVTLAGKEKILHAFGSTAQDGVGPEGGLLNVGGVLYGTTEDGGGSGKGTVFSITRRGAEAVLHSFGSSDDGEYPLDTLLNVGGTLYGTTARMTPGNQNGTVFSITPQGTESVVYSFQGLSVGDGAVPAAGLIDVGGTLYGTTAQGGAVNAGTVFSITPQGVETLLHSFGASGDGAGPSASLLDVGGTLYGTTEDGGDHNAGTVFSITRRGVERVLYSFGSVAGDGSFPVAPLIDVAGTLFGTTSGGGATNSGTVFSITP